MISLKENKFYNNFFFINLLVLIPALYVSGSLFVNLYLIVFSFFFLVAIIKKELIFKKNFYIISLLFLIFVIFNSFLSNDFSYVLFKFLSYLRFPIFLIVFSCIFLNLDENKKKKFIIIFTIINFIVLFDTLYQFIFDVDLLGFKINYTHAYGRLSGPFGDEFIVGSFLYCFGIVNFYLLNRYFIINKQTNFCFLLILSLVIFLTGERSAFLSVLIFLILCLLVCKNNRPLFFKTIIVLSFSVFLIFQNFKPLNDRYNFSIVINDYSLNKNKIDVYEKVENYTGNNQASLINRVKLKYTMLADSVWFAHYRAAILIFKNNLFIGSGFRTYRFECPRLEKINNNGIICTNHPHNIYLELASDLGLVGLFIFIIFIIKIIKDYILKKFYKKFTINILFFGFLSFLFPFKPHGSLFSTNYSFIFWFLLTFIIIEFFYSNENKNINS